MQASAQLCLHLCATPAILQAGSREVLAMTDEPTGRARGGKARAENLSPPTRSEIAAKGAQARWAAKRALSPADGLPRVIEGFSNVLDLAGVQIPCAVINGPGGIQRVLSENGITTALLGSRSGASKRKKKAMEDQG